VSGSAAADATRLADALAGMTGVEAWSVELGIGSMLTIDLGGQVETRYTVHGREATDIVGEWSLWIQLAAWRLEDAAEVLLGSEDPRPMIAEKIAVLRGRRVTAVTVTPPALETVFDFDGIRLLTFPVDSGVASLPGKPPDVQWSWTQPTGRSPSLLRKLPGGTDPLTTPHAIQRGTTHDASQEATSTAPLPAAPRSRPFHTDLLPAGT
jgi:hypothetical protein